MTTNGSKLLPCFLVGLFVSAFAVRGSHQLVAIEPIPENEPATVKRLESLCKLWGYIKYLHPFLAYRTDIDWDAALVATIPQVRNAKDAGEYAAALEGLLYQFGDPTTRIIRNSTSFSTQTTIEKEFEYRLLDNGVLVITAGNYFALWNPASQAKLKALVTDVPKAKAVVFDLRSSKVVGDYGKFQLASSLSPIESLLVTNPIVVGGERIRVHKGFESSSVFSSGQYKSGVYVQNAKRIVPAKNAKEIPSVFLLNENSAVLDSTTALQAAGKSLIVSEGARSHNRTLRTERLDLGEGLSAEVRLSEPVLDDGTSGELQPDKVVFQNTDGKDLALTTSLELAANFKPSTIVRKKLPSLSTRRRDSSYAEMKYPTLEYRLLAAFRIWNTIHYFFPYKDLMTDDWDSVLRQFIPKFEQAKDGLEYSLTVAEMMTYIHDSHAYVSGEIIDAYFGRGYPPIRVRLVEDALVVTHSYDDVVARQSGLQIGDVILKVDGEDAKERMRRYAKYLSASTPQSKLDKVTFLFLNGNVDSPVSLTVRNSNYQENEIKLPRKVEDFNTLYHRERSGEVFKLLPDNIGYVDLDRFKNEMLDEMFERFKNTRAIIFDMRGYPNGTVWSLVPRLTEKSEVVGAFFETPLVAPGPPAKAFESFYQTISGGTPSKWVYKGQTIMLIDERAQSQAEHTGLFLKAANNTKFVGSATAGANGELTTFSVPGGITTGFSGQSVKFPDGKQLQRVGLVPDIEVKPTIQGIREGRDEVLEAAIKHVKEKK